MSRCFPFPPPGYDGKCAGNEALIMSIKLRRENEKAKSDKKKGRKREKKEKKEKRREQQKAKVTADNETSLIERKSAQDDPKGRSKYELELLERSNLTEEHGQPCESSESTENSTKRKRDAEPPKSNKKLGTGNIIRIRVPSQNRKNPATLSNDGRPCSLSAGTGTMAHQGFKSFLHHQHDLLNPLSEKSTVPAHHPQKLDNSLPSLAARSATFLHQAPKMQRPLSERSEFSTPSHAPSTSSRLQDTPMQRMEEDHRDPLLSHKLYPPLLESMVFPGHDVSRSDDKVQKVAKLTDPVQSNNMLPPLAESSDLPMPGHILSRSRSHDKKMQKKTAKHREILEKWVPPPLDGVLTDC